MKRKRIKEEEKGKNNNRWLKFAIWKRSSESSVCVCK